MGDDYHPFDLGEKFKIQVEWQKQKIDGGKKRLYVFLYDKRDPDNSYEWAKFIRLELPSGETPMVVKVGEGYVYEKLHQRRTEDKFVFQREMPKQEDFTGWFVWPF